ncbi:hypothetical protein V6N13_033610 [Hibiscus sabdariffa]|uniref:Uncharacterized protein n=1 Tax=Hibiscus sabdariffa TaxID=183260 RepID=A0ABR2F9Z9_9ROSI
MYVRSFSGLNLTSCRPILDISQTRASLGNPKKGEKKSNSISTPPASRNPSKVVSDSKMDIGEVPDSMRNCPKFGFNEKCRDSPSEKVRSMLHMAHNIKVHFAAEDQVVLARIEKWESEEQ